MWPGFQFDSLEVSIFRIERGSCVADCAPISHLGNMKLTLASLFDAAYARSFRVAKKASDRQTREKHHYITLFRASPSQEGSAHHNVATPIILRCETDKIQRGKEKPLNDGRLSVIWRGCDVFFLHYFALLTESAWETLRTRPRNYGGSKMPNRSLSGVMTCFTVTYFRYDTAWQGVWKDEYKGIFTWQQI